MKNKKNKFKLFLAGGNNVLGNSFLVNLRKSKKYNIISDIQTGVNLMDQKSVLKFFENFRPDFVCITNVFSGGINENLYFPATLIYKNLQMQINIIHSSYKTGVENLLFLGSSCMYPKVCPQPMKEDCLFSGKFEKSSEPYSISKLTGMEMCFAYNKQYGKKYFTVIPATTYGPKDDFSKSGHVISSLIDRFHKAKIKNHQEVVVWGTGNPRREFLYADDLVEACFFLLQKRRHDEVINVGFGSDISIKELSELIKKTVGFKGKIVFNTSKPDGTYQKLLESSIINKLGWKPKTSLEKGLKVTYEWYKNNLNNI